MSSTELQAHLDSLQDVISEGNAKRGFHEEGDRLRAENAECQQRQLGSYIHTGAALRNYYVTKLALVGTEVAEAVEELRNGRFAGERYYSGGDGEGLNDLHDVDVHGAPRKPEGVPSEVADIVIRCFDFADEAGFSLGEVIIEKLAFNATRGFRHGGKGV